jgi:Flp pilus assembly protein protease CpaA
MWTLPINDIVTMLYPNIIITIICMFAILLRLLAHHDIHLRRTIKF